ncbi:hypothetical protein E1298_06970 [Actinomadura rubrisoli]|uniref:Uncharacterized protein n=1 Tax=Actinomadura rubrisoli TaxID=2530368 RepID=A0A4R5CBM0_9ACTN|nr:hypothetical protein E1298_06970 [Actinomadura rubrisoli]
MITPVYHADGGISIDAQPGPSGPSGPGRPTARPSGGDASKRRLLLIGGGAAAVLAAVAALFAIGGTGSGDDGGARKAAATPSGSATPAPPTAAPKPVDITDEKTDPKDLAFNEVFPSPTIELGGRTFARDRWSINRELTYAANGAMLQALKREGCRKVVRATYLDRRKTLAVTSGIAVMPTKAAAMKVSKAGDPVKYQWFRGMSGKHAPDIDRAGGYAAVTVRGRYVVYAYVQGADGKPVKPGDPTVKQVAQQFLDYAVRPLDARVRG